MYRICIDEVCVRSSVRTSARRSASGLGPSGVQTSAGMAGARYSVSCMSRAGCSAGMLSASKQCHSSSTSGPSTIANPMRVKMTSMRSRTTVNGWRRPRRGTRPGQRDVDAIACGEGPGVRVADHCRGFRQPLLDVPFEVVGQGATVPPLIGRYGRDLFQEAGDDAVLAAQPPIADRLDIADDRCGAELVVKLSAEAWRSLLGICGCVPASGARSDTSCQALRVSRGFRRGLGLLGERRKRRGARDGDLRQTLPVERHAGVLEAVDELPIRQAVLACGGVDADDPQPAEIALLAATADERVLERRVDRFLGGTIQLALVGEISLGQPEQLLALRSSNRSSFSPVAFRNLL